MTEKRKKPTPAKKLSFNEAVTEVEGILEAMESGEVDIDTLGAEVKRAVELIQACRDKLTKTDQEVRELVSDLDTEADSGTDSEEDVPF